MSSQHAQLVLAIIVTVGVLAALGFASWRVLRAPDDLPDRPATVELNASLHEPERPTETAPAFSWPKGGEYLSSARSVEPVRRSFRAFLDGGPDYRRG